MKMRAGKGRGFAPVVGPLCSAAPDGTTYNGIRRASRRRAQRSVAPMGGESGGAAKPFGCRRLVRPSQCARNGRDTRPANASGSTIAVRADLRHGWNRYKRDREAIDHEHPSPNTVFYHQGLVLLPASARSSAGGAACRFRRDHRCAGLSLRRCDPAGRSTRTNSLCDVAAGKGAAPWWKWSFLCNERFAKRWVFMEGC